MKAGWQHGTRDYDPATGAEEVEWARAVALEGWRTWHPSGVWLEVNGRRVRRWALRRPCYRPGSVHDHARQCREARTPAAAVEDDDTPGHE